MRAGGRRKLAARSGKGIRAELDDRTQAGWNSTNGSSRACRSHRDRPADYRTSSAGFSSGTYAKSRAKADGIESMIADCWRIYIPHC
jgi:hypothetical protein